MFSTFSVVRSWVEFRPGVKKVTGMWFDFADLMAIFLLLGEKETNAEELSMKCEYLDLKSCRTF